MLDFRQAGIPVGVVNTLDRALGNAHVLHRNMVIGMSDGSGHKGRVAGTPVKSTGEAEPPPAYPPPLGRDTRSVLADVLGCSAQEITSLIENQVVFERPINPRSMAEKT